MKKIFHWSVLTFVFFIPLSSFLSTRLLLLIFLLSFFLAGNYSKLIRTSWAIFLYLFILILGVTYSDDFATGLKILETSFSFFALMFVFGKDELDLPKLNRVLYSFLSGLFIACFICLVVAIFNYFKSRDSSVFLFYNLTNVIHAQPTYMAYYLIFAITFGLYLINFEKPPVHSFIAALFILFFFLILLLTGGQTAFVSLLLVFSFFVLKFFLGGESNNRVLVICLVSFMMVCMFLVSSTEQGKREVILNDSWDRFTLWQSAIRANSSILFGVGTGDGRIVLNEYFTSNNLDEYAKDSLNSHNEFIQVYLSNGCVGLLALVVLLAQPLYLAFRKNSSFGILIFFPFLIYGMTEVFLGRYQGVVFFALLHQIFVSYYASLKPAFSLKEN